MTVTHAVNCLLVDPLTLDHTMPSFIPDHFSVLYMHELFTPLRILISSACAPDYCWGSSP